MQDASVFLQLIESLQGCDVPVALLIVPEDLGQPGQGLRIGRIRGNELHKDVRCPGRIAFPHMEFCQCIGNLPSPVPFFPFGLKAFGGFRVLAVMHEHEGLLEAAWHEGCAKSECGNGDEKQDEPAGHRMAGLSLDGEMTTAMPSSAPRGSTKRTLPCASGRLD